MNDITPQKPTNPFDAEDYDDPFAVGKWVYVKSKNIHDEEYEWLGCVMRHGSNYVKVEAPAGPRRSGRAVRVHVDKLFERLRPEDNAEAIIASKMTYHQHNVKLLLGKITAITQRLGIIPKTAIADRSGDTSNALAVVSEQVDADAHKKALIKAKDEDLPALFKQVEEENEKVATWMSATILPMQAQIAPMKGSIKQIETRLYTVELYAGLTEGQTKVKDGDPAARDAKLRVMQRLHYMDEECLLDYDAGGMEIEDIHDFDAWLSRPKNFERLLPFERSCIAFQVRRNVKERYAANFSQAWFNIQKEQTDKWTFLYVRNGEQLWRIGCDFEFPEKIFPDADDYDPGREMMMEMFTRVSSLFPKHEYDVAMEEYEAKLAKWEAEKDPEDKNSWMGKPHLNSKYRDAEPFTPASVYFDDAMELVEGQMREFNRVGVILQGLFDRSLVLHPHNPVKVWDPVSFNHSIELIYDATTLTHGDPPDFAAFKRKLGETLGMGSVVIGQERVWWAHEAEKEQRRRDNDWRSRDLSPVGDIFEPYGDPGPGFICEIEEWKPRARKATFRWKREPMRYDPYDPTKKIDCSITVEASRLFNVSAYKPGDYLQFFEDPRTRQEYLKWAPLLLAAEDWHAKNKD